MADCAAMELGLSGKTVLVTGASGGIGRALAEAFGAEGARVACHTFRKKLELTDWLATRPWKDRSLVVTGDMRLPAEMDTVVEQCGRLEVCVANAGARPDAETPLHECSEERIRETVEANLLGAVWTARAFLKSLARTRAEATSLILIGSTAATFGERGYADYAAAKAGLVGLLRSAKNEITALDPRGRVNLIDPGWTATHVPRPALEDAAAVARAARTMPLRQLGRAEDVARAALWLASPTAARHVTGQILTVAGGMEGRILWDADDVDGEAIRSGVRD
jgi:3-oxoacyl-[acyl-carrier protein] reductase